MADSVSDLDDIIDAAAASPKSATADGQSATARDLKELTDYRNVVGERQAASGSKLPIRFFNTKPPGAV